MSETERQRKLAEARDAIANGRPDDAEEFTLEFVAEHGDPVSRDLVARLFESRG